MNYTFLATQTEGYSATDLQDLVSRAFHQLAIRASGDMSQVRIFQDNGPFVTLIFPFQEVLTVADFAAAQVDFIPLSLRDVNLQKSEVAWSDIGGMRCL